MELKIFLLYSSVLSGIWYFQSDTKNDDIFTLKTSPETYETFLNKIRIAYSFEFVPFSYICLDLINIEIYPK